MATYLVGDIQGCLDELKDLLDKVKFDPGRDRLRSLGDLVNRGPRSLDTLRFLKSLDRSFVTVLGNHDLHLLAVVANGEPMHSSDTFDGILQAPDREALLGWLSQQPMAHYDPEHRMLMVHAGVPPQWDLATTLSCARELESAVRGGGAGKYFSAMYGNQPARWSADLDGQDRLRYITNALTRMRFLHTDGSLDFDCKAAPGQQPPEMTPWFEMPGQLEKEVSVSFGHWAALEGELSTPRFEALDTGCVWGGSLTCLRLEDRARFSVPSRQQ